MFFPTKTPKCLSSVIKWGWEEDKYKSKYNVASVKQKLFLHIYIIISSVSSFILPCLTTVTVLLTNNMKSRGSKIVPCGTPWFISNAYETIPHNHWTQTKPESGFVYSQFRQKNVERYNTQENTFSFYKKI